MRRDSGEKEKFCRMNIFYQPSSENNKSIEWTEKLDFRMSIVKSTCSRTIMTSGYINFDLLASRKIKKRYIEVIEIYNLSKYQKSKPNWEETYRPYHFQHSSKQNSSFRYMTVSNNE